jgi:aryl-alcohol dehydrogenase-like predicted oxidoreductase
MRYQTIPNTDLDVSSVCLGLANIGVKNTEEEGMMLLDAFVEAGGNFIDTARVYSNWIPGEVNRSERIIGDWLVDRDVRDRVVVATKGGHPDLVDNIPRLSPDEMETDLQGSLDKLQTDVVDLYYLHRDDTHRSVAEMLDVLHHFQQSGRVRYYACSNWTPQRMQEAREYAKAQGYTGFVANQMRWSVAGFQGKPPGDQTMCSMDRETVDFHTQTGMAAIPYNSQAGGFFSKLDADPEWVEKSGNYTDGNLKVYAYLKTVSEGLGIAISQIVLAYFWSQPFVSIPIVGCRNQEQLADSLMAVDCDLSEDVIEKISELTTV